jgi:iron complex transport system substrate-binding protein
VNVFWLSPRRFEDIADAVEALALLTGQKAVGAARAARFRDGIAILRAEYESVRPIRVFYQIWDQPLMTINREELIGKAIELCGGVNVFGEQPRLVPRISTEAVLDANPEAIVTSGRGESDRAWLNYWKQFPGLKAVDLGNLFLEPPDLLARPTLRMLEGVRHLCQTLEQARARL